MRHTLLPFICCISLLASAQVSSLTKHSIPSSMDGVAQTIYYHASTAKQRMPLLVQLHSWSFPADSLKTLGLDSIAIANGYNYLFPNFRGVNNHPKACCSDYVINDLDEAIDWALQHMNVDKKRIYIVGYSGGGYATLAMYMKSRHKIRAFSAWCPITDLEQWYKESVERKNKYAAEIIQCTNGVLPFDSLKARERSPFYWKTPVKKRRKSTVQIYAGIHDGHTGPVPITQSINFYNKRIADYGAKDASLFVAQRDADYMLAQQSFDAPTDQKLGDKLIHLQRKYKRISLTIFEGGHDMLSREAFQRLK